MHSFSILNFCSDALFPPQCASCKRKLPPTNRFRTICDECFSHIPLRSGCVCATCGRRIPEIFGKCRCAQSFTLAAASSFEHHAVQSLVRTLKYHRVRDAALPLGYLLSQHLEKFVPSFASSSLPVLLVPIPLHPRKERMRGFNQSLLIAQALCNTLHTHYFTIHTEFLSRNKNTPSQTAQPNHYARKENITNTFTLHNPEKITGNILVLLDDVSTSGATLCEAARCIKTAHPKHIVGFVTAKA